MLDQHWHHLTAEQALERMQTHARAGLDTFEVRHRQEQFGPNLITARRGRGPLGRFLLQFHNPLIYILLVASVVTALIKDALDAGVIFAVVLVNAIISYLQETRAEEAIAALARTLTVEAIVVRGGRVATVPASELVPGDLVQLQAGARVPADLRLTSSRDLRVTEAMLTGESVPVEKDASNSLPISTALAERHNMAYTSTLVTYGSATGVVVATGDRTELGRISELISSAETLATPLTRKLARFSKVLLMVILALAGLIFVIGVHRGAPMVDTLMAAIALAVGAIPEGLPAAVTVTLAIGVSRMARRRAVIRHLPAVETLGSTTVICSDKTGTLTQNQMTVQEIRTAGGAYPVSGSGYQPTGAIGGPWRKDAAVAGTLRAGFVCNDSQLVETDGRWTVQGDPTEGALLCAAHKAGIEGGSGPHGDRLDAIPFDSQHQYMATLDAGGTVFVKGAVEVLLARCTNALDASGAVVMLDHERVRREMEEMATAGLRVLAFAHRTLPAASRLRHDDIAGLTFLGLQGMIDPPRPEAIAAVRACHRAGISVKMITGDHALTAAAIARQLGIGKTDEKGFPRALSGAEIARLSDEEVVGLAEEMDVFARVAPEQKLRLVDALQARGHVVAMTGDGVNDGPALKQADIGVAMGITGTEVAKEAADMVLTDDNFASIEAAVEEGRGVFDNLTKFIAWTLPTNAGEALVLLAAIVAGVTLPILPIQLLWINLTTAALLGTTLAFEPKEPDIMGRPPRSPRMPLLTGALTWRILLVSVIILVGAFGLFEYELQRGASVAEARTVAVNVVVLVQILYLWNARSLTRSPLRIGLLSNPWVIGGTVMMALVQLLFTHAPFMNRLFSAAPLPRALWLDALAVGLASFAIVEVEKWLRRRLSPRSPGEGDRDPR